MRIGGGEVGEGVGGGDERAAVESQMKFETLGSNWYVTLDK